MYFLFVLVVCLLSLHYLRITAILLKVISIIHINTLKYSSTIVKYTN